MPLLLLRLLIRQRLLTVADTAGRRVIDHTQNAEECKHGISSFSKGRAGGKDPQNAAAEEQGAAQRIIRFAHLS